MPNESKSRRPTKEERILTQALGHEQLEAKRHKAQLATLRARMADHFYSISEPVANGTAA